MLRAYLEQEHLKQGQVGKVCCGRPEVNQLVEAEIKAHEHPSQLCWLLWQLQVRDAIMGNISQLQILQSQDLCAISQPVSCWSCMLKQCRCWVFEASCQKPRCALAAHFV